MTKSNYCILGPARSRTTLIADALSQLLPGHTYIHEPGLLNGHNDIHLPFGRAKLDSIQEINRVFARLESSQDTGRLIVKMVSGATFFDLTPHELERFGTHCNIILAQRGFKSAAISYLAAMKTRRFFTKDQTAEPETLVYDPDLDDARLFWYTHFYAQSMKWEETLEAMRIPYEVIQYHEATSYDEVAELLGFTDYSVHWNERVQPPYTKPYAQLFVNYAQLEAACDKLEANLLLI